MPKFFVNSNQILNNKIKIIGNDINHIQNVLRLKQNDEINISNIDTVKNYVAKIEKFDGEAIICDIIASSDTLAECNVKISVFQGLPKADKMEYIIQKSTELGAYNFIPVNMKRCIVKLDDKTANKKIERWNKIAESAAKQSGRDIIPKVEEIKSISDICSSINNYDILIVAFEGEESNTLKTELKKLTNKENLKIGIVIGPEGGIDIEEVNKLQNAGAKIVTLGKRILRTETAPIAMISNIVYELEM